MKKILFTLLSFLIFGCEVKNIDYLTPIMITGVPEQVLANSALLGGEVIGEGGKDVSEYGIVWSENFPPTIDDFKSIEGSRIGFFSKTYTNLKANTTYYCSAYGINEQGVGYGRVFEFKTSPKAPCSPSEENTIDLKFEEIKIDTQRKQDPFGFNDGNVEFEVSSSSASPRIIIQFNEIGQRLPLTGEYITVREFDGESIRSNGEVKLKIIDFSIGGNGGDSVRTSEKIYIENDGKKIDFIFCDVTFRGSNSYVLNGKFTYLVRK